MEVGCTLRAARLRSGISQAELARRAGTSQATISAYENGAKEPSVAVFARLLAATGARLAVEPAPTRAPVEPSKRELERAGKTLADVIALAEALPSRQGRKLRYPRVDRAA
jgi:transcriptional regulator with XRE-family HTH domain